jgi:predicted component of type VI protein secretion system
MLTLRGAVTVSVICCLCSFGLSGFIASSSAGTPIYSYKDDSGTPTFTTDFGSIPEQYRNRAVPLHLDNSPAPPVVPSAQRPPSANIRVVTANGEYRMGDHDTRADAIRLAVEAAKRDALEQVATYLESVTEMKNMDITKDDIRTYTAGIVMVLDQKITTQLEGESIIVRADLTAQVDPDEVAQAIQALRENESAKTELAALRTETDQLHQQLDAANQALTTAVSPEQVQALSQERQDLLNQLQANALVSQAWTDWVYVTPVVYPYPWIGLQQVHGLLFQAHRIHPRNRHLPIVQEVITTHSGTVAPPPPGVPPTVQPHASLLVPPPAAFQSTPLPTVHPGPATASGPTSGNSLRAPTAVPPQTLTQGSTNSAPANSLRMPTGVPVQPFSNPLPPTLQQVHPPHVAQPNPPVLRAPYSVPHYAQPSIPQHVGGGGGHFGGGNHGGGLRGR